MRWLISPREDLLFVLGSVLVAWAMYAVWVNGLISTNGIVLIWIFVFHGPHFWATISRTYADREQYRRRRKLFNQSLIWYAIGPVVIGLGLLLEFTTGRKELIQLFFFLAAVWAFHHVAKQHFGFLALYRAKHKEFNKREFLFQKHYLLTSLWMPALIMLGTNIEWLIDVPFAYGYATSSEQAFANVRSSQEFLRTTCTSVFVAAQVAFAGWMIWRVVSGRGLNLPLVLLVACAVPLSWFVIMGSNGSIIPGAAVVLVPILTTYHNIQYHGLVWHYNRTKYKAVREKPEAKKRLGWALVCNRNFATYAAFGLLYTSITIGVEKYGALATESSAFNTLVKAFFWGFAFHHYYLDSKIWRASEDAELRAVLGFGAPTKKPDAEPAPSPALAGHGTNGTAAPAAGAAPAHAKTRRVPAPASAGEPS